MAGVMGTGRRWTARLGRLGPTLVVLLCAFFFVAPLLSMARFALQTVPVVKLGWSTLFDKWSLAPLVQAFGEPQFRSSLWLSVRLGLGTVLLTLALLVPTAVWVNLRLPRLRPVIEFITVMPYVIPAIALVAGIKVVQPHARWFLDSKMSLIPFYVVLALPFTYRSIDAGLRAIDLRTLVDASRSLGAGWGTTLVRVLLPNLRTSIISASFLIFAIVLGEFTMANVLVRMTLPVFMLQYQGSKAQAGTGLALMAMFATIVLFVAVSRVTRPRSERGGTTTSRSIATTGDDE